MENQKVVIFDGKRRTSRGSFVSATNGTFRFTKEFSQKLKGFQYVLLGVNKQNNTFMFYFSSKKEDQSLKLTWNVSGYVTVSSRSFIKAVLGIEPKSLRGKWEVSPNLIPYQGKEWYVTMPSVPKTVKTEVKTKKTLVAA